MKRLVAVTFLLGALAWSSPALATNPTASVTCDGLTLHVNDLPFRTTGNYLSLEVYAWWDDYDPRQHVIIDTPASSGGTGLHVNQGDVLFWTLRGAMREAKGLDSNAKLVDVPDGALWGVYIRWIRPNQTAVNVLWGGPGKCWRVSLSGPSAGSVLTGDVPLGADVATEFVADHVDFLVDGNVVATDDEAPFEATWDSTAVNDGAHTLVARATDPSEKVATSQSRSVTVDNTAPQTSITSGPTHFSSSVASFAFAANESAGFECKLDSLGWAECTSPKRYSGLLSGVHTFQVRATDATGNVEPTPATWTWTADTVAPDTVIDSAPPGPSSNSASFSFSTTDPEPSAGGLHFECKLDGSSSLPCASPKSYTGLSNGPHTLQVMAIDAVGNVDPTPALINWTAKLSLPFLAKSTARDLAQTALRRSYGRATCGSRIYNATRLSSARVRFHFMWCHRSTVRRGRITISYVWNGADLEWRYSIRRSS